jgi:hypothetical protein
LLTAVGLTPGGSSTVRIYTQTIRRTAQLTTLVGRLSGRHQDTKFTRAGSRDFEVVRQEWEKMKHPVMGLTTLCFILSAELREKIWWRNLGGGRCKMLFVKVRDTIRKFVDHTYILDSLLSVVLRAVQLNCICRLTSFPRSFRHT